MKKFLVKLNRIRHNNMSGENMGILPYLMILPAMLFLIVFTFYPMFHMVYLSFFNYDLVTEKSFVGLKNYDVMFHVAIDFWPAVKNTLIYTLAVVIQLVLLSLIFAVWLQKSTFLNALCQRIMFFPYMCAIISISMIFQWLLDEEGLVNSILKFFHLPLFAGLGSSATALLSVILISTWKNVGYYTLILLSSLKAIPAEIHEAAELDDTGTFRKFFKITVPMLSPQIFFLLITITISSFRVFETVQTLTGGGPGNSTMVLVYYIYKYAFHYFKFGYACAAGTVLLAILMILTFIYFKVVEKKVHYR